MCTFPTDWIYYVASSQGLYPCNYGPGLYNKCSWRSALGAGRARRIRNSIREPLNRENFFNIRARALSLNLFQSASSERRPHKIAVNSTIVEFNYAAVPICRYKLTSFLYFFGSFQFHFTAAPPFYNWQFNGGFRSCGCDQVGEKLAWGFLGVFLDSVNRLLRPLCSPRAGREVETTTTLY